MINIGQVGKGVTNYSSKAKKSKHSVDKSQAVFAAQPKNQDDEKPPFSAKRDSSSQKAKSTQEKPTHSNTQQADQTPAETMIGDELTYDEQGRQVVSRRFDLKA
jgi:hypothetical protein